MGANEPIVLFERDEAENLINQTKHGVSFQQARHAFTDPYRIIYTDLDHSIDEDRLFCLGVAGGGVMTVRFMYRANSIRIIAAGYWTKGKRIYCNGRHSLH